MRGYASHYGKKFETEEGHMIFTGSEEINPHLDITVALTVEDCIISIHLDGTIEEPVISFSSTPELPQTEIISPLGIGKTTNRSGMRPASRLRSKGGDDDKRCLLEARLAGLRGRWGLMLSYAIEERYGAGHRVLYGRAPAAPRKDEDGRD